VNVKTSNNSNDDELSDFGDFEAASHDFDGVAEEAHGKEGGDTSGENVSQEEDFGDFEEGLKSNEQEDEFGDFHEDDDFGDFGSSEQNVDATRTAEQQQGNSVLKFLELPEVAIREAAQKSFSVLLKPVSDTNDEPSSADVSPGKLFPNLFEVTTLTGDTQGHKCSACGACLAPGAFNCLLCGEHVNQDEFRTSPTPSDLLAVHIDSEIHTPVVSTLEVELQTCDDSTVALLLGKNHTAETNKAPQRPVNFRGTHDKSLTPETDDVASESHENSSSTPHIDRVAPQSISRELEDSATISDADSQADENADDEEVQSSAGKDGKIEDDVEFSSFQQSNGVDDVGDDDAVFSSFQQSSGTEDHNGAEFFSFEQSNGIDKDDVAELSASQDHNEESPQVLDFGRLTSVGSGPSSSGEDPGVKKGSSQDNDLAQDEYSAFGFPAANRHEEKPTTQGEAISPGFDDFFGSPTPREDPGSKAVGDDIGAAAQDDLLSMTLMQFGIKETNDEDQSLNINSDAKGPVSSQDIVLSGRSHLPAQRGTGILSEEGNALLEKLWEEASGEKGPLPDYSFMRASFVRAPLGRTFETAPGTAEEEDPFGGL